MVILNVPYEIPEQTVGLSNIAEGMAFYQSSRYSFLINECMKSNTDNSQLICHSIFMKLWHKTMKNLSQYFVTIFKNFDTNIMTIAWMCLRAISRAYSQTRRNEWEKSKQTMIECSHHLHAVQFGWS